MLGRKPFSTRAVAATLVTVALIGGCREASTGPSDSQSSSFASAIRLVSGNSQVAAEGATLAQTLTVKVIDVGGLAVKGATVSFVVKSGGGQILPASTSTGADGLATATWTLGNSLGSQMAVARLAGSFVTDSVTFSATATVGSAGIFSLVSGNNQVARVSKTFAAPLVVKVTDANGNNVSGQTVTWTVAGLSGVAVPAHDTTAADGTAQTLWTAGNTASIQTLTATVGSLTPIVFTATVTPDTARVVTVVSGAAQSTKISSALPTALTVRVTDQYGNPIVGDLVNWQDSLSGSALVGGGKLSAQSSLTDATGLASTSWTLGPRVGTQLVRARDGSLSNAVTFTATATIQFSDIEAGNFQACGVAQQNNNVYCWGLGDAGQLGRGTSGNISAPTLPVSIGGDSLNGPFLVVRQLYPARGYMCALTTVRQMYCWGDVIGGSGGAVQSATFQNITDGGATIVPSLLANGLEHQCVLTASGQAVCTGFGRQGQIGNNATLSTPANTYSLVSIPPIAPGAPTVYANISAGRSFSCGIARYNGLPASQVPYCWGFNGSGQIGDGTTGMDSIPTKVLFGAGVTLDSSTVSAGGQHACAVTAVGSAGIVGAAWCWGSNGFGQLGNGVLSNSPQTTPVAVTMPPGVTFAKMYAGEYHSCALTATGAAYCWGRNDLGQAGIGSTAAVLVPTAVSTGVTFKSLSLGELFTCGVTGTPGSSNSPSQTAGVLYCWGDNIYGQLGNRLTSGGGVASTVPTLVAGQP